MQLKDSVLSLVATESGKTFAGLADGTLVVFEVSYQRKNQSNIVLEVSFQRKNQSNIAFEVSFRGTTSSIILFEVSFQRKYQSNTPQSHELHQLLAHSEQQTTP